MSLYIDSFQPTIKGVSARHNFVMSVCVCVLYVDVCFCSTRFAFCTPALYHSSAERGVSRLERRWPIGRFSAMIRSRYGSRKFSRLLYGTQPVRKIGEPAHAPTQIISKSIRSSIESMEMQQTYGQQRQWSRGIDLGVFDTWGLWHIYTDAGR